MATPPRPGRVEVDAALDRIRRRHERVDDPDRGSMGTEPREVLAYLRRRSASLPRAVAADDVWDELILSAAVRWEELARERALLRRARHLGLSLSELAAHHGIRTRQGMQDHLDRLDALVDVGRPDVHLSREARRREKARPSDQRWLDAHQDDVVEALTELLRQVDRTALSDVRDRQVPATASERAEHDEPAELEWVDELRVELEDEHLAPATMALLGLLLGELRTHPTVRGLDLGHGLHRAIRSCERIRSRWEYARGR